MQRAVPFGVLRPVRGHRATAPPCIATARLGTTHGIASLQWFQCVPASLRAAPKCAQGKEQHERYRHRIGDNSVRWYGVEHQGVAEDCAQRLLRIVIPPRPEDTRETEYEPPMVFPGPLSLVCMSAARLSKSYGPVVSAILRCTPPGSST